MKAMLSERFPSRSLVVLVVMLCAALLLIALAPSADAQSAQEPPMPLYALPDENTPARSSNSLALANDNLTLAAANMLSNSVTLLQPSRGSILAEIPVGIDPRSVAFTPNSRLLLTANRGDHTLSIIGVNEQAVLATVELGGLSPYGVVARDDNFAYVTLQNSDEVVLVDLTAAEVVQRIAVPDSPTGLALWGDFLYVTHFWSGEVTMIYVPQGRVIVTASTGLDTGAFQAMAIDQSRGVAYLPQTRLNAQNTMLTYDSTAFPIVNILNLADLVVSRRERIALAIADRPVNLPFGVALDLRTDRLYVANAGTNDVTVIDLETGLAQAHLDVGANPRGLLLSRDATLLYVHNTLDSTISIILTRSFQIEDVLPISTPTIPNDIFIGAQLFHSAEEPRMSADGWVSCATCHFDGESDGRVWQGFPGGPRNTPQLYQLPETAPYLWTGHWDELADVELKIRDVQSGAGLIEGDVNPPMGEPNAGLSSDLDTLVAYLLSIPSPGSSLVSNGEQVARGQEVFEAQGCDDCHVGQVGTNLAQVDVGTLRSPLEQNGALFDTPGLRWLWLSDPYFHDGEAETLREVFELPGTHQLIFDVLPEDIDALVAYLLTVPQPTVP